MLTLVNFDGVGGKFKNNRIITRAKFEETIWAGRRGRRRSLFESCSKGGKRKGGRDKTISFRCPARFCVLVGIQPSDCAGRFHHNFSQQFQLHFRLTLCTILSTFPIFRECRSTSCRSCCASVYGNTCHFAVAQLLCSLPTHAVPRFRLFAPRSVSTTWATPWIEQLDRVTWTSMVPTHNLQIRPTVHLHLLLKENWTTIRKNRQRNCRGFLHSSAESVGHCNAPYFSS